MRPSPPLLIPTPTPSEITTAPLPLNTSVKLLLRIRPVVPPLFCSTRSSKTIVIAARSIRLRCSAPLSCPGTFSGRLLLLLGTVISPF